MARNVSDALRIMRLVIGRRNENDPDSNDSTLLSYLNDFVSLSMSDDVKLFNQWGTLEFHIDETTTDGVYDFPSGDTGVLFTDISPEVMVSLYSATDESTSWQPIEVYQDPRRFYNKWGINNETNLIRGFPTEMLYYNNQFIFRTLPDDDYLIKVYAYVQNPDFSSVGDPEIPRDYWLRYLAYGAAMNWASDYRSSSEDMARIKRGFARERSYLMQRNHDLLKIQRGYPSF